ncbi:CNT_collapsed_G0012420.mRNA.1.CDS.1 [Saccharomyces cerevisiae]|nr:CNB_1a_G0012130.mRNA.1.CDS.1 [Saccharomyces cerevisiae]CAI7219636.1 CNB_1a_G0012130.mRNA.1.CDS.1 [Saccharomyces cerevisiae]CAI7223271.1 CNT_collapsed_G0012420.mRNA.1.CDS.1 [Saccharomyces cerevisiae]
MVGHSAQHRSKSSLVSHLLILLIFITIIIEMCLYNKIFKNQRSDDIRDNFNNGGHRVPSNVQNHGTHIRDEAFISGVYYSNWSPYKPRFHFPHDINLKQVSYIYYAFFKINSRTGGIENTDSWSDLEMNLYKSLAIKNSELIKESSNNSVQNILPLGCIGELFYLKNTCSDKKFKVIMSIGGWSDSENFKIIIKDDKLLQNFVDSSVETMFRLGFDGIDLDWEFPGNNESEPRGYLKLVRMLRLKLNSLESQIFGERTEDHFQLSIAAPAFKDKLFYLPITEIDQYVDYWNMMTYDYYGSWSETTGYHSNLFSETELNGNFAMHYMIDRFGVNSRKLVLGMAAYGRSFHIKDNKFEPFNQNTVLINKIFKGVGKPTKEIDKADGKEGIWPYKNLPKIGTIEQYDPKYVSAYCFDEKNSIFISYDNTKSVKTKAEYVTHNNLGGGFWWESCGEAYANESRSLINAFNEGLHFNVSSKPSIFQDVRVKKYYLNKYGDGGFLSPYLKHLDSRKQ